MLKQLLLVLAVVSLGCGVEPVGTVADGGATGGGTGNSTGGGSATGGGSGGGTAGGMGGAGPRDAGCTYAGPAAEGLAITAGGPMQGALLDGVWHWLGVPFAAPPVGALRWRSPAPPVCTPTVRVAASVGPVCPQLTSDGGYVGAEDCLTLDVWSKQGVADAGVMLFIHGGGNLMGSSSDNNGLYAGQNLANRYGVVAIAINYRLGALGYFAHAQLNGESDAGVSGNYGILDQQAALRWVRDNVRAFGGNPDQVMVFGESGGAQDTVIQLVAPGAKGLFKAAAVESGGVYKTTLADAITSMAAVTQGAGCASAPDAVACLRGSSAQQLTQIPAVGGPLAKGLRYGPAIDGVVIPDSPVTMISQGKHNHVAVIIGTNADETSRMVGDVQTEAEYEAALAAQYGSAKNLILAQYPASRFTSFRKALVAVTTDGMFTCGTRRIARALAAGQTEPVYRYFFTFKGSGPNADAIGSTHGAELPFVFGTYTSLSQTPPSAATLALGDLIQGYWTRLAVGANPNGGGAPNWPAFAQTGIDALELGNAGAATIASVRASDCDFWDQF